MAITIEDVLALEALDSRLRTLLPEQYKNVYEDVMPVSMGSAGLKYGDDGRVAWNDMWKSFCDLAMAGGPPHRGSLLEPGSSEEISAQPDEYERAVSEICRGIGLVTGLKASPAPATGWIQVECKREGMAAWLVRAIVMENVSARYDGRLLYLPAGPAFRLQKEIKNVITVIAKTCHYWTGHTPDEQQQAIEETLGSSKLLQPGSPDSSYESLLSTITERINRETGRPCFTHRYVGWIGVECTSVRSALWTMRGIVVSDVLARREGETLFLPVNPVDDPEGKRVVGTFVQMHHLATVKKIT